MKRTLFFCLMLLCATAGWSDDSIRQVDYGQKFHETIEAYRQGVNSQYEPKGRMKAFEPFNFEPPRFNLSAKTILLYLFAVLILAALVVLVCHYVPQWRSRKNGSNGQHGTPGSVEAPSVSYWDSMRQLAGQGDYSNAIFEGYQLLLQWAEANRLLTLTPSGTPLEYYTAFPDNAWKADIGQLTRLLLNVRYGNRPATAEDYRAFETIIRQLSQP